MNILAFESSCDETAAAVVRDGRTVLSSVIASSADMHAIYGGVVPEIASRKHVEAISGLADEALCPARLSKKDIDAVGACVGNRGMRVNAIVSELGGEKIDIIHWCPDILEFIARALSPAKVVMVQVNDEEKAAKAVVMDDMLSLAIGKDGQNARLAARLTGWKIDVKPYSSLMKEEESAETEEAVPAEEEIKSEPTELSTDLFDEDLGELE